MKFVQLKKIRDLVMLVASSHSNNVIQHMASNGEHIYFVLGGTLSQLFIYLVKLQEPLDGDFITYNSYSGEIGFSERILTEPNLNTFPIIDITNQDLLPEELLGKVANS